MNKTINDKQSFFKSKHGRALIGVAAIGLLVLLASALEFGIVLNRNRFVLLLLGLIAVYTIAVSGLDVLFGYSGQISLGHAGFWAVGAYASILMSHGRFGFSQWFGFALPPIITIFLAGIVAMAFGVLIAFPASKLVAHFLALLTIAFGELVFLAIISFPNVTNAFLGVTAIPPISLFGFAFNTNYLFFLFALVLTVIFLIVKQRIIHSRVGRALIAIRENPLAANGVGVNLQYYKVMSFAISAFFTGVSGAMYAHLVGFISPETFMFAQSVIFLTMLIFGGAGNLFGPIVGVIIIVIMQEALQAFSTARMLIYGIFLLLTILFLPKGVFGIGERLRGLIRKVVSKKNA